MARNTGEAHVSKCVLLLHVLQDVRYPEYLDMRPFMSQSQGEPQVYGLYAVLVHSGFSCHAGHYFCYIKVWRHFYFHFD